MGKAAASVAVLYASDYGFSDRLSQTLARGITKAGVATEMLDLLSADPQAEQLLAFSALHPRTECPACIRTCTPPAPAHTSRLAPNTTCRKPWGVCVKQVSQGMPVASGCTGCVIDLP